MSPSGGTNDHGSVLLNNTGTAVTQAGATLAQDRYYSSMVTLGSGRPIILGGNIPYSYGYSDPNGYIASGYMGSMTPEAYDPATGWRSLFGANSRIAFGPDFSRYRYPRAWLAPNGQVFGISSEQMWSLDATGNGSVTSLGGFKTAMNFATGISAKAAPNVGPTSTAVMYDIGKILQVGGNGRYNGDATVSSSLATTIDINGATPAVRDVAPMSYGRQWAPDGPADRQGGGDGRLHLRRRRRHQRRAGGRDLGPRHGDLVGGRQRLSTGATTRPRPCCRTGPSWWRAAACRARWTTSTRKSTTRPTSSRR